MHSFNALVKAPICAAALAVVSLSAQAGTVYGQGTWEATLQTRDINGDGVVDAYYDTALNITWLADWNANGQQSWAAATTWAASLNVYGKTGWRLPSTTDTGTTGCDFSYAGGTDCGYNVDVASSELAHMFYMTLGNKAYCPPGDATCGEPQPGWGLTNTANFFNLQSGAFWSGTEYEPGSSVAWVTKTYDGFQKYDLKTIELNAVAVRPGDVAAVPEPQTAALILAGLSGLLMSRRRRR